MLMEHSTSAVNWQPRNVAKRPGEMARNSLSHVARGADAVLFFQWRASRSGAEKFHSAMLPHAGTGSRAWREVVALGGAVERLAEVQGSTVQADVAILWDQESFWAQGLEWRPSIDVDPRERMRAYYERLWRDGITVDFAHPSADLSGYRLVVAPASYLLTVESAQNLTRYVASGGTLLVSFFSAVVDEHDAVHDGGFGAPLRDVLGLVVEEFLPLRADVRAHVQWTGGERRELATVAWQEDLALHGAEVVGRYLDGPAAGGPAITRHRHGSGTAWYVSTAPAIDDLEPVLRAVYSDAGLAPADLPPELEVVTRRGQDADYVVAINHGADDAKLPVDGGLEMLSGAPVSGLLDVPAGGVAVVRLAPARKPGGGRHP
jgi:beta-galactosidase